MSLNKTRKYTDVKAYIKASVEIEVEPLDSVCDTPPVAQKSSFFLPDIDDNTTCASNKRQSLRPLRFSKFMKIKSVNCDTPKSLQLSIPKNREKSGSFSVGCSQDYLYVKSRQTKNDKENSINQFLDNKGIRQIHLSAAFDEIKEF